MSRLNTIFEGWDGYQTSLLHAVEPLTSEQLLWRPAPQVRALGEIVRHFSLGRITWLSRMDAPGVEDLREQVPRWYSDSDGARHAVEDSVPSDKGEELAHWLDLSWRPIQRILDEWQLDDLFRTYVHRFLGTDYVVSNQWMLWRVLSHDIHHGGQVAMMLACQNIPAFELRALGGHIIAPPFALP